MFCYILKNIFKKSLNIEDDTELYYFENVYNVNEHKIYNFENIIDTPEEIIIIEIHNETFKIISVFNSIEDILFLENNELLEWVKKSKYKICATKLCIISLIDFKNVFGLNWFYENNYRCVIPKYILKRAFLHGLVLNTTTLHYERDKDCRGITILKWLKTHGHKTKNKYFKGYKKI